jgi:hypothetical protein
MVCDIASIYGSDKSLYHVVSVVGVYYFDNHITSMGYRVKGSTLAKRLQTGKASLGLSLGLVKLKVHNNQ